MKKYMTRVVLFLAFVAFLAGCLKPGTYRVVPQGEGRPNIATLTKNWQDYSVTYAGHGPWHPAAVMFERKDDDHAIAVDRWSVVESPEALEALVVSIRKQGQTGPYYPRLFEILGPDDHLYGYMFTAWDVVLTKMIDERTLFVFDMPLPPYLAINGRDSLLDRTPR